MKKQRGYGPLKGESGDVWEATSKPTHQDDKCLGQKTVIQWPNLSIHNFFFF